MKRKRKQYSKQVREIVKAAKKFAAEKKAAGWTRADFAASLKKMFESPTGEI